MQTDLVSLWESVTAEIEVGISPASFQSWIKPCFIDAVNEIDSERLLVELACPSGFHQRTIDERYYGQIKSILEKQTGKKCEVGIVVKQKPMERTISEEKSKDTGLFEEEKPLSSDRDMMAAGLNPRFTFDNFVVGGSNNLAYAAARGVVDTPGIKHNPLFLWGGVGVGKTHLMHAVGKKLIERGLTVRAVTSEQFTNELIMTIRNKSVSGFKKKYRNLDVLMIDDIQFIAGKESTQEEFFHTFNELYMKGAQIIMTSDRRPQDIEQVEQRLISRFLGGLTVDIGLPDYEMRLAILKQKCSELKVEVDQGVLELMAESVTTNARELEGVLTRVVNVATIHGGNLTKELVEKEIGVTSKKESKKLRPQELISLVAKTYEYKNKELLGNSRKANLVQARHVAMFLLREEMGLTLQNVAELMGGRDHTTVMHAVEKVKKEFEVNQGVREKVIQVKQAVYGG
jgi:chromosomal replication initiator protein